MFSRIGFTHYFSPLPPLLDTDNPGVEALNFIRFLQGCIYFSENVEVLTNRIPGTGTFTDDIVQNCTVQSTVDKPLEQKRLLARTTIGS